MCLRGLFRQRRLFLCPVDVSQAQRRRQGEESRADHPARDVVPRHGSAQGRADSGGRRRFLYLEPGEAQPPLTVLEPPAAEQGGFPEEAMEQQP